MSDAPSGPDPTALTTDALRREIANVVERVDREVAHLRELLAVGEAHRVEQKQDSMRELDAALAAAKEAVGKSEVAFADQLRQLQRTFESEINRLGEGIVALDAKQAALFKTHEDRIVSLGARLGEVAAALGG